VAHLGTRAPTATKDTTVPQFDVVVLGGGTAGENTATALATAGRRVALVEQHRVGGECPFTACMPSKAMLRSGEVRHLLGRARELGTMMDSVTPVRPDKGFAQAVRRRDELVDHRNDAQHADGVAEAGVTLFRAHATVTEPGVVDAGDQRLEYDELVIATGAADIRPPIEGLDQAPTWTSADAWSAQSRPESLLIIGGGPVGCEIAQLYARFDVAVTIVEASDQLASGEASEVAELLQTLLTVEGVEVITGAESTRVATRDGHATVHLDNGTSVDAARVVVATGVEPRLDGLGLERLGLDVSDGIAIDDRCRVIGADHVWAAGDVTMVAPFTHVANYQARIVSDNLLGGRARADYRAIPRCIYTDPPVVGVGTTIEQATGELEQVVIGRADLSDLPRTNASGSNGGQLVLVADGDQKVLVGASAIGPMADAWIHEAVLAVRARVPLAILRDTIHAFPTFAEAYDVALSDIAGQLRGRSSHT